MKIGILGGTFDPPHAGHVAVAEAALVGLELDEILFIPAHRNPMKSRETTSPAKHRLAMVQSIVAEHERFACSDMEITRGGASYTVDTLVELHMARPAEYWLIMGSDALKGFENWKAPHRILQMARLAVVVRPPATRQELLGRMDAQLRDHVDVVDMKPIDVSSTDLRKRVALGQNVAPWLAPAVSSYIKAQGLYKTA